MDQVLSASLMLTQPIGHRTDATPIEPGGSLGDSQRRVAPVCAQGPTVAAPPIRRALLQRSHTGTRECRTTVDDDGTVPLIEAARHAGDAWARIRRYNCVTTSKAVLACDRSATMAP